MKVARCVLLLALAVWLSGCAEVEYASHVIKTQLPRESTEKSIGSGGNFKVGNPYKIDGRWYYPKEQYELVETGIASWYGPGFHGKKTASGETFDKNELTAAHRTLQMPSLVRVTNLDNGKSLIVRVNDRGPYKRGRVMDVSERAAELLGFKGAGTAKVRLEVLKQESLKIAQTAKSGRSTKGYELAMNGRAAPSSMEASYEVASVEPATYDTGPPPPMESVNREFLTAPSGSSNYPQMRNMVPGHMRDGEFYPDPVVTEMPVTRTGIYVQAGSFGVESNARALGTRLAAYGRAEVYPAMINGQQFFRVRLGPIGNVGEADELLARLVHGGHNDAIIVVE